MSPTQLQGQHHHVPKLGATLPPRTTMTPNWLQLPQINPPGGTQPPLTIGCCEVDGHCEVELGPGRQSGLGVTQGVTHGFGVGTPLGPQAGLGAPTPQFRAPPSVPALRCHHAAPKGVAGGAGDPQRTNLGCWGAPAHEGASGWGC